MKIKHESTLAPALLAVVFTALVCSGCYKNSVNGEDGNFAFAGPHAAVIGETITLQVAHDRKRLELCGKSSCGDILPGQTAAIDAVLALDSDVSACELATSEVKNGIAVITVHCPGPLSANPTVHVRAHLQDGSELEDRFSLAFLPAARIALYCKSDAHCGGSLGVFPGATITYYARIESADGTPLYSAKVDPIIDGDAATISEPPVETAQGEDAWVLFIHESPNSMYPAWQFTCKAVHPGTASVRVGTSAMNRVVTISVAALENVVDGALITPAPSSYNLDGSMNYVEVDRETTTLISETSLRVKEGVLSAQLLLTLLDGSRAWGGADLLSVDRSGVISIPTLIGQPDLSNAEVRIAPKKPGVGQLILNQGAAHRQWSFNVAQ